MAALILPYRSVLPRLWSATSRHQASLAVPFSLVFALGCTSIHYLDMDGYLHPQVAGKFAGERVFVVENENAPNLVLEAQVAQALRLHLSSKSLRPAELEDADIYAFSVYGATEEDLTRVVPIRRRGGTVEVDTSGWYAGEHFSSRSTVKLPSRKEYRTVSETRYRHSVKVVLLDARRLRTASEVRILWLGEVWDTKGSADFRQQMHPLLGAVFKHFGQNTGHTVYSKVVGQGAMPC